MERLSQQNAPDLLPVGFGYLRLILNSGNEVKDYVFLDANPAFGWLMELGGENIIGKKASEVFHGKKRGGFDWVSYFGGVARTGRIQETTHWIETLGQHYKTTVIPLDHETLGVVIQCVSVEPGSMEANMETAPLLESLKNIFNRTHDAILLVKHSNNEFRYLLNNTLHQKLTGFSDLRGMSPVELLGEELGKKLIGYYEQCISTGLPVSYEQKYNFAPGKRVWHTEVTPIFGLDGVNYLLCSSKDITELKAAQGENELLTRRLQSMFDQHTAIMLIIDPDSGRILDANPAACAFYGYTKNELRSLRMPHINTAPPEETRRLRQRGDEKRTGHYVCPHRLKNGEIRLVDEYSSFISDGKNTLLYSIIFDVTDRETYRDQLFQEKEVLRTTLRSIGDGVVTTDDNGFITSLNSVARELTGWENDEAKGKLFTEVFLLQNEETGRPVENPIKKVLETGRTIGLANHTELINRYGQAIPIADSAAPIKSEDGRILGVVMVFRDVRNEKEQCEQIRFLSYHDQLTGLFNRHYIEETLQRLDTEENLPFAVIMGDVNGLKITNDVFGHETGDALLRHTAMSLVKNCQKTDLIARWGGDEFVVFMPRTELSTAEEIIRKIQSDTISVDQANLHMSISFGCAAKEKTDQTIHSILRQAEEHMYHQKLLDGKSYRGAIIDALLAILYEKSDETEDHSKRMQENCSCIGKMLQLSSKEMDDLALLTILHDIGKVSISIGVLQKAGALTPEEWKEMKRHAEIGYRIAQTTPELAMIADFILSHHERWDGKGYPRGLRGEEIPLVCRVLAVTDAFDAMTNDRGYRRAMSREEAILELKRNAGSQFDPLITTIFIEALTAKETRGVKCAD